MLPDAGLARRAGVLALVLACGCQPVNGGAAPDPGVTGTPATAPPAAPQRGVPGSLAELLSRADSTAAQWQSGAKPAQIAVDLEAGVPVASTITYLAPDADRFLLVRFDADGLSQERPTLDTLALQAVTAAGLEQVPALPEGTLDPGSLLAAASQAGEQCGLGDDIGVVLYATGAPAAWDGANWVEPPGWTALLSAGQQGAVQVDPATGAATGETCVAGVE